MLQDFTKVNKKARLFICFILDDSFFNSLQQVLYPLSHCSRIVFTKNFHLTLKFLGDVERSKIPDIVSKLKTINFSKFSVELADFGFFGKDYPKVVYMGLTKNNNLELLKHSIDSFFGKENFYPHITLARLKSIENISRCKTLLHSLHNTECKKIVLDKFFLMESNLTSLGSIYTVVDIFSCK